MRLPLTCACAALLVAGNASAQSTIVSPVVATNTEGADGNLFPWASPIVRRYQQVHADLGPGPKTIRRLAFRLIQDTGNYTGAWTVDLEMFMGVNRGIEASSQFFDRNYLTPRTMVVARTVVNWGPQGQAISPGPNPFHPNTSVLLSAPYLYSGAPLALVWEVLVYANTFTTGGTGQDADVGSVSYGWSQHTGTGCIAGGRSAVIVHTTSISDVGGYVGVNFTLANGPANVPAVVALGTANPNLAVPGLCSNLLTNVLVFVPIGTTDATGSITNANSGAATFFFRNTSPGAVLYTQVHAPDATRPGLPIANSSGRSTDVPIANRSRVCDVMRVFNNAGGTTATEGVYFNNLSQGYGLVTQFTY